MKVLKQFPDVEEFYARYWGRAPFVVRGAIEASWFDDFVDGDELAGLALEEDIKSRIVITSSEGNQWDCEYGPFEDSRFSDLGERNWSLLVQNVEQYHTNTAQLLSAFNFAPRWLMDDIMVSYSAPGGTVGPHTDSYHVFLVQGKGRRSWTVGDHPVENEDCIDGLELKVLKDGIDGEPVEVQMGDVIYIPPHFAHEGMTLETAMTFSVGFLGPKISELFIEYGHYLEQQDAYQDERYSGNNLKPQSAGFVMASDDQAHISDGLVKHLKADHFTKWLAEYFSMPTDGEELERRENEISVADLEERLQEGDVLYRPEQIKLTVTSLRDGSKALAVYGDIVPTTKEDDVLVKYLCTNGKLSVEDIKSLGNKPSHLALVAWLYNHNALNFQSDH